MSLSTQFGFDNRESLPPGLDIEDVGVHFPGKPLRLNRNQILFLYKLEVRSDLGECTGREDLV